MEKQFNNKEISIEVLRFAKQMQIQLDNNVHKGSWKDYRDLEKILVDLEYHKAKLLFAIKENNPNALLEYIADCANILMMVGNTFYLFDQDIQLNGVHIMTSPVFVHKEMEPVISKKLI